MSRLSASDSDRLPLIQGRQGRYYIVDGQKYDEHFPQEWALNHLPYPYPRHYANMSCSGPKECDNCNRYGSINDVFIFYCASCYRGVYNGERGGFIYCSDDVTEQELWTELPYMNGVKFDEIGDAKVPTHWNEEDDDSYDEDYVLKKHGQRLRQRKNNMQKEQWKQNKVAQVVVENMQQITEEARAERKKKTENEPYEAISSDDEDSLMKEDEDVDEYDFTMKEPFRGIIVVFLVLWMAIISYYLYYMTLV
jgi:hypothetical protein